MKIKKLLSDWILVELEPEKRQTRGGIIFPDNAKGYIRCGKVLMAGPGRYYTDKFTPMDSDIVGKRVAFFIAALSGHRQGQTLKSYFDDDQGLIRRDDVLLILEEEVTIE